MASWTVPLVLGLVLGACRAPLPVGLAVLLVGRLFGPPAWTLLELQYNEVHYLPGHEFSWLAGLLLCVGGSQAWGRLDWTSKARVWLGWGLLSLLLVLYPFRLLEFSPELLSALERRPEPGYSFDGIQQLLAFQQYQHGDTYWQAQRESLRYDSRSSDPGFVASLAMRSPLLFWVLGPLPGPSAVAWAAWLLTAVTAGAIYKASCRLGDPLLSLASPSLLLCLYAYVQSNYWLFIQDPWATQFLLLGLSALILWPRWPWAAVPFFTLAFGVREFDGLALVALIALYALRREKGGLGLGLLGLCLCFLLYAYHIQECQRVTEVPALPSVSARVAYSPQSGLSAMRFGSSTVLGRDVLMPLLFLVSVLAPFRVRQGAVAVLTFHSVSLLILFFFLGKGGAHYSYNITPLFCWGAGLVLAGQEWPTVRVHKNVTKKL